MRLKAEAILAQVKRAIVGKDDVLESVLMAILAGGHVLLNDVPGVGKTTLAVAISRAMGLDYRRIQFTPDVLPSDIVGFSRYDQSAGSFAYLPGVVNDCNLLLADEINRTSSKTQSALLEAMEEGRVTVDGTAHPLKRPFCVIATQNEVGTAGTQPLPQAQLDRFLVQLTIGYPDLESELDILRGRQTGDPLEQVAQVSDVQDLLAMQAEAAQVTMTQELMEYLVRLSAASRESELLRLGLSPRGTLAVSRMVRACAWVRGRDFAIPEDVAAVFVPVSAHRVLLSQRARLEQRTARDVMEELRRSVPLPGRG